MITLKKEGLILIIILVTISLITSATVVQVDQQKPVEKPSFWSGFTSVFTSFYFWLAVVILILIVIFGVGLFFLVRWLVKFIKKRNDIFYKLKTERKYLAKLHRRYDSKHFWKVNKNTPIRLVKKENDKFVVSRPIGWHRGDYTANEGNLIISLNLEGDKHWYIFPRTSLLVIPDKDTVNIWGKDKEGKDKIIQTISNIPRAKDIIQFNENEILIFAESLAEMGHFLIPVLKSKDGKIIDLSLPVFHGLNEIILGTYLYDLTSQYAFLSKKGMELNPDIRAKVKLQDSNQNVDIPHQQ
jgi:prepilin signal peptidase PulO-like enzyme (type II secretory pathway)